MMIGARTLFILLFILLFEGDLFAKEITLPDYLSQNKIEWSYYKIKKGDSLRSLFGKYWMVVARFNRIDEKHIAVGIKIKVPHDLEETKKYEPLSLFIDEKINEEKFIFISLSEQWFGFYEYGKLKFSGPISSGKERCIDASTRKIRSCETPEGEFEALAIHRDHVSSKYKHVNGKNIPMPFAVLFLQKGGGYWMHEQSLPGRPDSHGCIRLMKNDAKINCDSVFKNCSKVSSQIWLGKNERIPIKISKLPIY